MAKALNKIPAIHSRFHDIIRIIINIKLTYADVDWIFGFNGGFQMANEMLLDILKQEQIIPKDIGQIILTPKEDEPSIYVTLKIISKGSK